MLLEARQRLKGLLSGGRHDNFEQTETEYVDDTRFNFEQTETEYFDDTRFNALIIFIIYHHQVVI